MACSFNEHVVSLKTEAGITRQRVRTAALANGCTLARFNYAVEAAGSNPDDIAAYLVLNSFVTGNFIPT